MFPWFVSLGWWNMLVLLMFLFLIWYMYMISWWLVKVFDGLLCVVSLLIELMVQSANVQFMMSSNPCNFFSVFVLKNVRLWRTSPTEVNTTPILQLICWKYEEHCIWPTTCYFSIIWSIGYVFHCFQKKVIKSLIFAPCFHLRSHLEYMVPWCLSNNAPMQTRSRSKELKAVFLKEMGPEKNNLSKAREALQKAIDRAKAVGGFCTLEWYMTSMRHWFIQCTYNVLLRKSSMYIDCSEEIRFFKKSLSSIIYQWICSAREMAILRSWMLLRK